MVAKALRTAPLLVFLASAWLCFPADASAASLSISPGGGTVNVGEAFAVRVNVSTGGQAVNAVSAQLNFPADKIEVVSLNKSGSIFSMWIQEPAFSNQVGTVKLDGVILNPGFSGDGRLVTVMMRPKAAGEIQLSLSEGQVLLNDGQGTNVLDAMGSARFVAAVAPPSAEPVVKPQPKPEAKLATTTIVIHEDDITDNLKPTIMLHTDGARADRYEVVIEGSTISVRGADFDKPIELPEMFPGMKDILIRSFYKEKVVETRQEISIRQVLPPTVLMYPKKAYEGEPAVFWGVTYPRATTSLIFTDEEGNREHQDIVSDEAGHFAYERPQGFRAGTYTLFAHAYNRLGARSERSTELTMRISRNVWSWKFVRDNLAMISIPFILGILVMLVLLALRVLHKKHGPAIMARLRRGRSKR